MAGVLIQHCHGKNSVRVLKVVLQQRALVKCPAHD